MDARDSAARRGEAIARLVGFQPQPISLERLDQIRGVLRAQAHATSFHGPHCLVDGLPVCGWPELHTPPESEFRSDWQ